MYVGNNLQTLKPWNTDLDLNEFKFEEWNANGTQKQSGQKETHFTEIKYIYLVL